MRLLRIAGLATLIVSAAAGPAFAVDRGRLTPVAKAQVTGEKFVLTLQSDPGDFIGGGTTYRYTDADVQQFFVNMFHLQSAATANPDYMEIIFHVGKGTKAGDFWDLTLGTNKLNKSLVPGNYPTATRAAFALDNTAGLDFDLNGSGCNTITGRFTISAIAFDCKADSLGTPQPHLKQLLVAFEQHCEGVRPAIRGQLSYLDTTGISCDTGTGDGSGGGSGGSGTPTPAPSPTGPIVVLSDDTLATPIVMNNSSTSTVLFSTFAASDSKNDVTLSVASDSEDLIATLNKSVINAPGIGDAILTLRTTPKATAGNHVVTITATDGTLSASASVFVTVLCDPPFILGIDQPKSSSVSTGRPAQLSVKVSGSGPFTYQWFTGASGLVNFPLAGGTSANFTTSALNDTTSYWVRVSNPCGSVVSQTATVNISPSPNPAGRR
jgi:hypothetical protein